MALLDTRWKNPQSSTLQNLYLWAQDLIRELRKGDYLDAVAIDTATLDGLYEKLGVSRGINTQIVSYSAVLADAGKTVEMNIATSNNFLVPANASVAFEVGTWINVVQVSTGQTTFVADTGVTLRSRNGTKTAGQWAMATIYKRQTNTWVIGGDVTV